MIFLLAFILSKMNLLILVTALAAIIVYFMFGLTDIVVSNSAQQIVNAKAEQALGIANSNKQCFSTQINMPYSIKYFGSSREYFYAMKISRIPEITKEGENNTLIFAIANRQHMDKIIAAKSIDTDAEIVLFGIPDPETFELALQPSTSIVIDPQAVTPITSFVLVKETYSGENYLYAIACSFSGDSCQANLGQVGGCIRAGRVANVPQHESSCFPAGVCPP